MLCLNESTDTSEGNAFERPKKVYACHAFLENSTSYINKSSAHYGAVGVIGRRVTRFAFGDFALAFHGVPCDGDCSTIKMFLYGLLRVVTPNRQCDHFAMLVCA